MSLLLAATCSPGLVGLAGTVVVITGGRAVQVTLSDLTTYLLAFGAALAWALYTVLLRRRGDADRYTALFLNCAFVIVTGLVIATGQWTRPPATVLLACIAIGAGPLAVAFVAWDIAVTRASIARVGVFSYLDPLLSTLFLVLVLGESLRGSTAVGMALIVVGVVIAEHRQPRAA